MPVGVVIIALVAIVVATALAVIWLAKRRGARWSPILSLGAAAAALVAAWGMFSAPDRGRPSGDGPSRITGTRHGDLGWTRFQRDWFERHAARVSRRASELIPARRARLSIVRTVPSSRQTGARDIDYGYIVVSGSVTPLAATHTATIGGAGSLGASVVRADQPAMLAYRLKPFAEVRRGEANESAAPDLLEAIAEGADIEVTFGCNTCDEADSKQAPQRLAIDRAAFARGAIRSGELVFPFTPRTTSAFLPETGRSTHLSLMFRYNGQDLDTWLIPITVRSAAAPSPAPIAAAAARSFARYKPRGERSIRLGYAIKPGGAYSVTVSASAAFLPWLRPLGRQGKLRIRNLDSVEVEVASETATGASFATAGNELERRLETIVAATSKQPPEPPCADAPADIAAPAALAAAIRGCILSRARDLRTQVVPEPVQQFLYDLARCDPRAPADSDWDRRAATAPPAVIVTGTRYLPLQFMPIDTVGNQPASCSLDLKPIGRNPALPPGADDYLGLVLPVAVQPSNIADLFRNTVRDTLQPEDMDDDSAKELLAGIYLDERLQGATPTDPLDLLFEDMKTRLSADDGVEVVRNAQTFLEALARQRHNVRTIVVNAHGVRRGAQEDSSIVPPDNLIFSHWQPSGPNPGSDVPDRAFTSGVPIMTALNILQTGEKRLFLAPTVLLLACETAPYRDRDTDANSIPSAFITIGAGAVVATEVAVPAALAKDFGSAFLDALDENDAAVTAYLARRALLLGREATPLGLLWSVVVAPQPK